MRATSRLIITFATLHQVLAAEKALRSAKPIVFKVRPTPTPPGLSTSICGMSIEILQQDQKQTIVDFLTQKSMPPSGVFEIV
jgi:Protein of unknown function (DUF3343)